MSDWHDYNNNLVYAPEGDWADTEPKTNTDRTQSSLDLVDKIEKLTKQLEIAVEALELYKNLRGDGTLKNYESLAVKALAQIEELEK